MQFKYWYVMFFFQKWCGIECAKVARVLFLEDDMKSAVEMVMNGRSVSAAEFKNVGHATLSRYVKKIRECAKGAEGNVKYKPNYSVRLIFTPAQEETLKDLIMCSLSKMYYALPVEECRVIAYEMAVINKITCPKSWEERKRAGIDWFYGFMQRHPKLNQ